MSSASDGLDARLGKWMWADAGLSVGVLKLTALAVLDPLRWSRVKALSAIITELEEIRGEDRLRPVLVEYVDEETHRGIEKFVADMDHTTPRKEYATVDQAIEHLGKVDVAALRHELLERKHAEFARAAGPEAIRALSER